MEFLDENKNIIGYDRDIIAAIAEEIGMKREFRNIAWDGIFASLESGQAIFDAKSKTRIICLLGASGTLRYKEIRDNLDGLTDAVLAATLRDKENDRIINTRQYNELPTRVEYSLSEKGASAHKILRSICCRAVRYCPLPGESLPPCKKVGGCPL